MNKRIIRVHAHKLATAMERFRRQHLNDEDFGLSPLLRHTGISIGNYIAAAFEEKELRNKIRLLQLSLSTLEEGLTYLLAAEQTERGATLKIRIEATIVSIHLQSYINTLKK